MPFQRSARFFSEYLRLNSLRYFQILFIVIAISQIKFFGSQYSNNDDTAMAQVASGGFTGKPSQYLIVINVVIGWILRGLYTFAPTIPWYALLIMMSVGFASTTLCNIIFQRISSHEFRSHFSQKILITCLLSPIIYYTYANIQTLNYSSTAFFCSVCGILGMILSISNDDKIQIAQPMLIAIIGFLWRDTAFLSVVMLTTPVVLISLTSNNWRKYFKSFSLLGLVVSVVFYVDRFSYRLDSRWVEYLNYDKARGALHGNITFTSIFQSESGYANLLNVSGFSPSQLDLFVGWFINMKAMPLRGVEAMVALTGGEIDLLDSRLHQPFLGSFLQIVLLVLSLVLAFMYFFEIRAIRSFCALSASTALLAAMFAVLDSNIRLPPYVRQGLTFGLIASTVTVLVLTIRKERFAPRWVKFDLIIPSSLALLLLTFGIGLYQNNFAVSNNTIKSAQRDFSESANRFSSSVFAPTLGSNFPITFGRENPFGSFKLTSLNLIPMGWMINSPLTAERMHHFQLSEDIDQSILDGKLAITFGDETETLRTFQDYFCVTYSIPTIATVIKNENTPFATGVIRRGGTCESSLAMDGYNPQEPVGFWSVEPESKIWITNCKSGEIKTIRFNLHAPFGAFAKQITMRISGTIKEKESSQVIKVKPFQDNFVEIETTSCSINLSSLSAGVVPMLVDPASQDQRTLFFGLSDLRLISS